MRKVDAMAERETKSECVETPKREPYVVRLPGFLVEDTIGLGDVIKRATYSLGISACGGCERRAVTLNRWAAFSRRLR
jgi:hypothetical protein